MQEGLKILNTLLDPYDWFYEACIDNNRYIVYVHHMGPGIEETVPRMIMGYQVVVHFADSHINNKEKFLIKPISTIPVVKNFSIKNIVNNPLMKFELESELDRLENLCGLNILQDIFYETHDKQNAITNFRSSFPKVYHAMCELYDTYGFDLIFGKLNE